MTQITKVLGFGCVYTLGGDIVPKALGKNN